ncbi:MAG: hypothetical protein WCV83_04025 [Candidatus Magasanikbacteria bacterium]|jgi:hypothetical protein
MDIVVPDNAVRAVVLIAGDDELVKNAKTAKVAGRRAAKDGAQALLKQLEKRFSKAKVFCGRDPVSMLTAVAIGPYNFIKTTTLLDHGGSQRINRENVRKILVVNDHEGLTVAYGHEKVINKIPSIGRTGLRPGVEAHVVFIGASNKPVGASTHNLLELATTAMAV